MKPINDPLNLTIKPATPKEAAVLATLAEQTFRDTFTAQNDKSMIEMHCKQKFGVSQQRAELENPAWKTLVLEDSGIATGFIQIIFHAHSVCEIHRIYLTKPAFGAGNGKRLIHCAEQEALQLRSAEIWLGVWEHNSKAIAFYKKLGYYEVGEQTFMFGAEEQRDLIMRKLL